MLNFPITQPILSAFRKYQLLLLASIIIVVAAFLRFYQLGSIPAGLNWDETAYAYNAFSLWKTGADEWGVPHPLFLKSFSDYKPALLSYLLIPLFQIFGTSSVVVRSVTAGLGSIAVGVIFLLFHKITKSVWLGFFTALVIAVSPWSIHFSRVALDPGMAWPLLIIGFYLWIRKSMLHNSIGAVLLVLSMYAYNAERVFVPLLVVAYSLMYWHGSYVKRILQHSIPLGILIGGTLLILGATLTGDAGARSKTTSFFYNNSFEQDQKTYETKSHHLGLPDLALLHSKKLQLAGAIIRQYSLYFRPDFLFFANGTLNQSPILGFPDRGNVLEIFFPMFVIGVMVVLRRMHREDVFMLLWLLLAPVAGILTTDGPHPGRALVMLPAVAYIIAVGILNVTTFLQKKARKEITLMLVLIAIALGTATYLFEYVVKYPEQSESAYQGYYREMSEWVGDHASAYDNVYISNRHDMHVLLFYAWYAQVPANLIQSSIREGVWPTYLRQFGNVYLLEDLPQQPSICALQNANSLVVFHPDEATELRSEPLFTTYYLNRFDPPARAFVIYDTTNLLVSDAEYLATVCSAQN